MPAKKKTDDTTPDDDAQPADPADQMHGSVPTDENPANDPTSPLDQSRHVGDA